MRDNDDISKNDTEDGDSEFRYFDKNACIKVKKKNSGANFQGIVNVEVW